MLPCFQNVALSKSGKKSEKTEALRIFNDIATLCDILIATRPKGRAYSQSLAKFKLPLKNRQLI
jgi:hypothetical protein